VGMRLSCNFENVHTIAYHVHLYTRASLIYTPNPNPDSSNRISSYSVCTTGAVAAVLERRREGSGTIRIPLCEVVRDAGQNDWLLGPFYGAIAVPSVTRCRCRRCCCCCRRGHRTPPAL